MECTPVDFGGRTPAAPCLGLLGCTPEDYDSVRARLSVEHNALVRTLNAWNALINKKTTWTVGATAAWELYESSRKLLDATPESWVGVLLSPTIWSLEGPITEMLNMAMADHAAVCHLEEALAELGETLPDKPLPPPPGETLGQEFLNFAKDLAKGAGVLVAVGIAAVLAYGWATRSSGGPRG